MTGILPLDDKWVDMDGRVVPFRYTQVACVHCTNKVPLGDLRPHMLSHLKQYGFTCTACDALIQNTAQGSQHVSCCRMGKLRATNVVQLTNMRMASLLDRSEKKVWKDIQNYLKSLREKTNGSRVEQSTPDNFMLGNSSAQTFSGSLPSGQTSSQLLDWEQSFPSEGPESVLLGNSADYLSVSSDAETMDRSSQQASVSTYSPSIADPPLACRSIGAPVLVASDSRPDSDISPRNQEFLNEAIVLSDSDLAAETGRISPNFDSRSIASDDLPPLLIDEGELDGALNSTAYDESQSKSLQTQDGPATGGNEVSARYEQIIRKVWQESGNRISMRQTETILETGSGSSTSQRNRIELGENLQRSLNSHQGLPPSSEPSYSQPNHIDNQAPGVSSITWLSKLDHIVDNISRNRELTLAANESMLGRTEISRRGAIQGDVMRKEFQPVRNAGNQPNCSETPAKSTKKKGQKKGRMDTSNSSANGIRKAANKTIRNQKNNADQESNARQLVHHGRLTCKSCASIVPPHGLLPLELLKHWLRFHSVPSIDENAVQWQLPSARERFEKNIVSYLLLENPSISISSAKTMASYFWKHLPVDWWRNFLARHNTELSKYWASRAQASVAVSSNCSSPAQITTPGVEISTTSHNPPGQTSIPLCNYHMLLFGVEHLKVGSVLCWLVGDELYRGIQMQFRPEMPGWKLENYEKQFMFPAVKALTGFLLDHWSANYKKIPNVHLLNENQLQTIIREIVIEIRNQLAQLAFPFYPFKESLKNRLYDGGTGGIFGSSILLGLKERNGLNRSPSNQRPILPRPRNQTVLPPVSTIQQGVISVNPARFMNPAPVPTHHPTNPETAFTCACGQSFLGYNFLQFHMEQCHPQWMANQVHGVTHQMQIPAPPSYSTTSQTNLIPLTVIGNVAQVASSQETRRIPSLRHCYGRDTNRATSNASETYSHAQAELNRIYEQRHPGPMSNCSASSGSGTPLSHRSSRVTAHRLGGNRSNSTETNPSAAQCFTSNQNSTDGTTTTSSAQSSAGSLQLNGTNTRKEARKSSVIQRQINNSTAPSERPEYPILQQVLQQEESASEPSIENVYPLAPPKEIKMEVQECDDSGIFDAFSSSISRPEENRQTATSDVVLAGTSSGPSGSDRDTESRSSLDQKLKESISLASIAARIFQSDKHLQRSAANSSGEITSTGKEIARKEVKGSNEEENLFKFGTKENESSTANNEALTKLLKSLDSIRPIDPSREIRASPAIPVDSEALTDARPQDTARSNTKSPAVEEATSKDASLVCTGGKTSDMKIVSRSKSTEINAFEILEALAADIFKEQRVESELISDSPNGCEDSGSSSMQTPQSVPESRDNPVNNENTVDGIKPIGLPAATIITHTDRSVAQNSIESQNDPRPLHSDPTNYSHLKSTVQNFIRTKRYSVARDLIKAGMPDSLQNFARSAWRQACEMEAAKLSSIREQITFKKSNTLPKELHRTIPRKIHRKLERITKRDPWAPVAVVRKLIKGFNESPAILLKILSILKSERRRAVRRRANDSLQRIQTRLSMKKQRGKIEDALRKYSARKGSRAMKLRALALSNANIAALADSKCGERLLRHSPLQLRKETCFIVDEHCYHKEASETFDHHWRPRKTESPESAAGASDPADEIVWLGSKTGDEVAADFQDRNEDEYHRRSSRLRRPSCRLSPIAFNTRRTSNRFSKGRWQISTNSNNRVEREGLRIKLLRQKQQKCGEKSGEKRDYPIEQSHQKKSNLPDRNLEEETDEMETAELFSLVHLTPISADFCATTVQKYYPSADGSASSGQNYSRVVEICSPSNTGAEFEGFERRRGSSEPLCNKYGDGDLMSLMKRLMPFPSEQSSDTNSVPITTLCDEKSEMEDPIICESEGADKRAQKIDEANRDVLHIPSDVEYIGALQEKSEFKLPLHIILDSGNDSSDPTSDNSSAEDLKIGESETELFTIGTKSANIVASALSNQELREDLSAEHKRNAKMDELQVALAEISFLGEKNVRKIPKPVRKTMQRDKIMTRRQRSHVACSNNAPLKRQLSV